MEPPSVLLGGVFSISNPASDVGTIHGMCTGVTCSPPIWGGSYGQGCTWGWCRSWSRSRAKDRMSLLGLPDDVVAAFQAQNGWRKGRLSGHAAVAQFSRPRARSSSFAVKEAPEEILWRSSPRVVFLSNHGSTWVDLEAQTNIYLRQHSFVPAQWTA